MTIHHPKQLVVLVLAGLAMSACARGRSGPGAGASSGIARPLEVYEQLGVIAGPSDFPAVASFSTMAGPADSTNVLVGISMPSSALRFQRDASGFLGSYIIDIAFLRDSTVISRIEARENVSVGSFAETSRTDESIIFQELIALPPGRYHIDVNARDAFSSKGLRTRDSLQVPSYDAERHLSPPILVYEAEGREARTEVPDLILNARKTVAYGVDMPRVYFELYDAPDDQPVTLRVLDEQGNAVWQRYTTVEQGVEGLRHAIVEIPADSLPLGRLWLESSLAGDNTEVIRTPLLVTISDQWMVANFDEVLRFLAYIAFPAELDSLKEAIGTERRERWEEFWARRDPLPATPINEFRESFFQRIRFATEHYAEPGQRGWETDRGEVYIVLGMPDREIPRYVGNDVSAQLNAVEWLFENTPNGRIQLLFLDRTGFGRYELTPSSEQTFRTTAHRLRPQKK